MPRHRREVLGVDERDGAFLAFQDVEDGTPIDSRRLHRDLRDAVAGQPIIKGQEIGGHRAEGAHLPSHAAVRFSQQDTGDDTLLMDIETTTAGMHDLHTSSSTTGG
jgi:hypothetical protein